MSGMILHLDEFSEGESHRSLRIAEDVEKITHLLDGSEYQAAGELTAELDVNVVRATLRVLAAVELEVAFECGRCLQHKQSTLSFDTEFVLIPRAEFAARYEGEDEVELSEDDMDVSFYEGEEIDLGPLLREAILLELPTLPRCSDDERETCDKAYRATIGASALQQLEEASIDHRWSALKDIKLKD